MSGGVVTTLSNPQTFTLKPLHNTPEATTDRPGLLAFQQETAEIFRVASGATSTAVELRNRLAHLKRGVETIEGTNQTLRSQIQALEAQLDEVDVVLTGDRTISSRNEPAPWPVRSRVSQIRGWGWQTQAPATGSNVDALEIAKIELDGALTALRRIETDLVALETDLEQRGAPFTPGSGVPAWKLGD